jgi:hypothetical protein
MHSAVIFTLFNTFSSNQWTLHYRIVNTVYPLVLRHNMTFTIYGPATLIEALPLLW